MPSDTSWRRCSKNLIHCALQDNSPTQEKLETGHQQRAAVRRAAATWPVGGSPSRLRARGKRLCRLRLHTVGVGEHTPCSSTLCSSCRQRHNFARLCAPCMHSRHSCVPVATTGARLRRCQLLVLSLRVFVHCSSAEVRAAPVYAAVLLVSASPGSIARRRVGVVVHRLAVVCARRLRAHVRDREQGCRECWIVRC